MANLSNNKDNNVSKFKAQKLSWLSNALCIHSVDFPIFYIECISERHFVVAGGGGASNTGVHNQINILELIPTDDSCAADLIMKYQTPIPEAIMAGSLIKDNSQIVSTRLVTSGSAPTIYQIEYDSNLKGFKIPEFKSLRDSKVRAEMKSVKYIPSNKILTGGMDGKLYVWDISNNNHQQIISAHTKEIDEIDVDLVNKQILTLSRREAKCSIWSMTNYKLINDFKKDFINTSNTPATFKNAFRSCKFAYNHQDVQSNSTPTTIQTNKKLSSQPDPTYLLIACNPDRPKNPSILFRVNMKDQMNEFKTASLTTDGIMAMTTSSDGKLFAIGTTSGTVQVFDVKNLIQTYKFEAAHYNIITNLAFLPAKPESSILTNSQTCPLLSASIDKRIVLHRPKRSSFTSKLCKLLCIFILMYLTFNLRLILHL